MRTLVRFSISLAVVLAAVRTSAAQDLAAEFSRLQSQVMASQARLVADMAEAKRLRDNGLSSPVFIDDEHCPRPTDPSRMPPWGVDEADGPRAAKARALLDQMVAGIIAANGLSIPNLCHAAIASGDEFRAWSHESGTLPDGRRLSVIVVYAGLLSRLDDDSELAAVLGHELSHLDLLHSRARYAQMDRSQAIAEGWKRSPYARPAGSYLENWKIGANVGQEADADHLGLIYMHRAGYDPGVVPRFFELYARYKPEANDVRNWQHPPVAYRAEAAKQEAEEELRGAPVLARPVRNLNEIQRLLVDRP